MSELERPSGRTFGILGFSVAMLVIFFLIPFGIMEPLVKPPRGKMDRKLAMASRALDALGQWMRDRAA